MIYVSVVQLRARETILHNSSLVDRKQRQPSMTRHGELMGQSLALRPIPSEGFFVSREHHDFGTKIGNQRSIPREDLFFFREHYGFGTKIGKSEIDSK